MTKETTEAERARVSLAALWFGVAAPTVYALVRLYEVVRDETLDPALIVRQVHTAYYFRCGLAVWFAAFVALLVFRAPPGPEPDRRVLRLTRAAAILVPLATLAVWLAP